MNSPVTGPVIGVVGGGQLARMMAPAATALGVELRVLAESPEVSAVAAVPTAPVGDYTDLDTLRRFAAEVDVLTFDHEHVPTEHLRALEAHGVAVRPGPDALEHAQDKLVMRRAVAELGLPNPRWEEVHSPEQLVAFGERVGWPLILKTPRGGYDGKGVLKLDGPQEAGGGTAAEWFERAAAAGSGQGLLAEEAVPFSRELSAMVARRPSGETVAWPVVESIQVAGVCDEVIAPAPGLDPEVARAAQDAAVRLAQELGVTGVMAVELFETPGTETGFAVNELAMRPHNSGHWSMDGSVTGQFEQHLRAVLDWPLGRTEVLAGAAVMKNVLGGENEDLFSAYPLAMAAEPRAKIHTYGKAVRPGRKVGHVNAVGGAHEVERLRRIATRAALVLRDGGDRGQPLNERRGNAPWGAVPRSQSEAPLVGLVMGSDSDWATMRAAAEALEELGIPYEADVVSAHRMPAEMLEYGRTAHERGLRVVIAGAGGAAHLPGMLASVTPLPVIGVPVALKTLDGMDSLLSIVQMPAGVPVATVSINGARNAGLLAARVLGSAPDASGTQLRARLLDAAAELSEAAHRKGAALRETVARGATSQD
ncbi:MAG: 5-(carboxyamino)imidazole ribonucleotide synthase [Kocuria sp.]|nr:5-(carboxyamino)imidazole ribonucleotide synthase [Kocuria sp.]MDO4919383.1 5-(carboxyamino)imidazole ribonucleotide synthase [Kocuria sp.]